MRKSNVALIAGLLALAAVLGSVALARTAGLGAAGRQANDAAVAAKTKQLAAYQAKLEKALAQKTPALPPLPKTSSVASPATAAPQQKVVYRRPPPVVVVKHTAHGDDGNESNGGGCEMTSHTGRLYSLAIALVVFFLAWAVIATHPWATRGQGRPAAGARRPRGPAPQGGEARPDRSSRSAGPTTSCS